MVIALFILLLLVVAFRALTSDGSGGASGSSQAGAVENGEQAAGIPRIVQALTVAEPHRGAPEYRRADWDHWVDEDGDCQDARQEVLIAESRVTGTFTTNTMCRVAAGSWFDEYSGVILTNPADVEVDHFVPLENAHVSGGWAWSAERRRAYANDLSHPEHLIAVRDRVNQSKGSKSPERWMPPRVEYRCDYAISWIAVKTRWALTVTAEERGALLSMLEACPPDRREGW
mgnify:CR=1 FL=1